MVQITHTFAIFVNTQPVGQPKYSKTFAYTYFSFHLRTDHFDQSFILWFFQYEIFDGLCSPHNQKKKKKKGSVSQKNLEKKREENLCFKDHIYETYKTVLTRFFFFSTYFSGKKPDNKTWEIEEKTTWLLPGVLEEEFGGWRALCACFSRQWGVPLLPSPLPLERKCLNVSLRLASKQILNKVFRRCSCNKNANFMWYDLRKERKIDIKKKKTFE